MSPPFTAFTPFTPKELRYAALRRRAEEARALAREIVARSVEARLEWNEIRDPTSVHDASERIALREVA